MIAVTSPALGVAPDAMAMAMLSGNATSATVIPASPSLRNKGQEYPWIVVSSFGFTSLGTRGDQPFQRNPACLQIGESRRERGPPSGDELPPVDGRNGSKAGVTLAAALGGKQTLGNR